MDLLLDTCTLLWALGNAKELPQNIRQIIDDKKNRVFVSSVSLWEIEIKHQRNPSLFPVDVRNVFNRIVITKIVELNIRIEHLLELKNITHQEIHKDPFDHYLLAMAKEEGMTLITHDENMAKYQGVKILKY